MHIIYNIFAFVSLINGQKLQENYFNYGVHMIPHPDKIEKNGEDAYFVNKNVLAVADGVGGWIRHGIDAGLYSKLLVKNVEKYVDQDENQYVQNPKLLIINAAQDTNLQGSSTLAITTLDKQLPLVYSSYIGDCGYIIYRPTDDGDLQTIYVSEEQQKSFNFPYQLAMPPNGDRGDVALEFKHEVQNLDIILNGSDGILDNLSPEQIKTIIKKYLKGKKVIQIPQLTKTLASVAQKLGMDKTYNSPFAQHARKAGLQFIGGKLDDITVVVAQIRIQSQNDVKEEL